MKWFKHYTDASDDEFIAALEEQYGLEGYARWWKMLEAIGKQMKPGSTVASASYPVNKWMTVLSIKRPKLFESFTDFCSIYGKIIKKDSDIFVEIEVPKLLEMRDEYSRKSGQSSDATPDKVAQEKDTEKEKEEELLPSEHPEGPTLVKMPNYEIPNDWKAFAFKEKGWTEDMILDVWVEFRDYWQTGKGKSVKRSDWLPTWRNWVRKQNMGQARVGFQKPQPPRKSNARTL